MNLWTRRLALLGALGAMTVAACARRPAVKGPPPGLAQDVRQYLSWIHERLQRGWDDGVLVSLAALPDGETLRGGGRYVEVAIALDETGFIEGFRLTRSSGNHRIDNSALRVVDRVALWPLLPESLKERKVTLRWRFYTDERGCDPRYVAVTSRPAGRRQALRLALAERRYARARQLLGRRRSLTGVRELLCAEGRASVDKSARQLALWICPAEALGAILQRTANRPTWEAALAVLAHRRDHAAVRRALELQLADKGVASWRLRMLTAVLRSSNRSPGEAALTLALAHARAEVVRLFLPLARDPRLLQRAIASRKASDPLVGRLALQLAELGQLASALPLLRRRLRRAPESTLATLTRFPLPALAADVAQMARDRRLPPALRVAAIRALGPLRRDDRTLFVLLGKRHAPPIRRAAIAAVGAFAQRRLAAAYRLANIAYHERGAIVFHALAALVRLNHPRFRKDVLYRVGRLPPALRARVVPRLRAFGAVARPALRKWAASKHPALAAAARRALAPEAPAPGGAERPAAASLPRAARPAPASPLATVLSLAISIDQRASVVPR